MATDLCGRDKFQEKGSLSPQRVNEVDWLLSINLSRYPSDNVLDIENYLEDLHVCLAL